VDFSLQRLPQRLEVLVSVRNPYKRDISPDATSPKERSKRPRTLLPSINIPHAQNAVSLKPGEKQVVNDESTTTKGMFGGLHTTTGKAVGFADTRIEILPEDLSAASKMTLDTGLNGPVAEFRDEGATAPSHIMLINGPRSEETTLPQTDQDELLEAYTDQENLQSVSKASSGPKEVVLDAQAPISEETDDPLPEVSPRTVLKSQTSELAQSVRHTPSSPVSHSLKTLNDGLLPEENCVNKPGVALPILLTEPDVLPPLVMQGLKTPHRVELSKENDGEHGGLDVSDAGRPIPLCTSATSSTTLVLASQPPELSSFVVPQPSTTSHTEDIFDDLLSENISINVPSIDVPSINVPSSKSPVSLRSPTESGHLESDTPENLSQEHDVPAATINNVYRKPTSGTSSHKPDGQTSIHETSIHAVISSSSPQIQPPDKEQGRPNMNPQIDQSLKPTRSSTMTWGEMNIRTGGRQSIAANLLFKYLSDTTVPKKQRKDKTSLSKFLSSKPYGELMAPCVPEMVSRAHDVWLECSEYRHEATRTAPKQLMKKPTKNWQRELEEIQYFERTKKTHLVAESYREAFHWQLIKQRASDEVGRLRVSGNSAEQQKALDQALTDYMVNKLGTETGSSFPVRKSTTKKRLLRLDMMRDAGLNEVLMYRSNAFSRHLGEIIKTEAADEAIMDWAQFINELLLYETDRLACSTESEHRLFFQQREQLILNEPFRFNNWSRDMCQWRHYLEAAQYFEDHPEVLTGDRYGDGITASNMHKYGFAGNKHLNYSWAVRLFRMSNRNCLVSPVDLPKSAFLGVVPGFVRYGCDPQHHWTPGPNDIWHEPTPSPLLRLFTPWFRRRKNVALGFEMFTDVTRPGKPCFRWLAFTIRDIPAFEELAA
jgi:hypothetical protein